METTFYSQNTGRFYPFDEKLAAELSPQWGACGPGLIKRGIVDAGLILSINERSVGPVAVTADVNCRDGVLILVFHVRLDGREISSPELRLPQTDFMTLKFSTEGTLSSDVDSFTLTGFVTVGYVSHLDEVEASVLAVPLCRSRIKVVPLGMTGVKVTNQDRWLPQEECWEQRKERPLTWLAGELPPPAGDSLRLRAGYNCQLTVNSRENRIVIQPKPGAGLGEVARNIPLGLDEDGVEEAPLKPSLAPRLDTISNAVLAKTFAGAYGENIAITADRSFISRVDTSGVDENGCPLECLVIEYVDTIAQCEAEVASPGSSLQNC